MPQERRSYSKSFKAQVIAECAQVDTSIANVALIRMIESFLDNEHEQVENLPLFMSQAAEAVRRAMNPETPQDKVIFA